MNSAPREALMRAEQHGAAADRAPSVEVGAGSAGDRVACGDTGITLKSMVRSAAFVPLLLFIAMAILFGVGLTMNPRDVPSPLIGKPVPEFSLPAVKGRSAGLSSIDLRGEVSLVNVFASWCTACREEHPLIMALSQNKVVPVNGLNYKDKPEDAERWLNEFGDPYARTGADIDGRVGIEWGVYGVPETFVVDRDGRIAYKHIGALTEQALRDKIIPLINRLSE